MARGNGQLRDDQLRAAISNLATNAGFDVEDITVRLVGGRRLVRAVVDRDGGVDLDTAAALSRDIASALDTEYDAELGDAAYTLEITSRGVGAPLTLPRHFRRAAGRLGTIVRTDGTSLTARIALVDDATLTLLTGRDGVEVTTLPLAEIASAKAEVEFSKPSARVLGALADLGVRAPHGATGETAVDLARASDDDVTNIEGEDAR